MSADTLALFRQKLIERRLPLFGSFIKTPSPHSIEILGTLGFDFVVIDAEHAPIDRGAMDMLLLAARAANIPALVRVRELSAPDILAALDDGATGVLVPHIDSVEKARQLVAYCRYDGARGFSNSPRAGNYGARSMWSHVDACDSEVTVIAMIEDEAGVDAIDDIVRVPGLDGVFVGRGDLAVGMNDRAQLSTRVQEMTTRVVQAAGRAGKAALVLASHPQDAKQLSTEGVTGFVVSSDQGFLRSAADQALRDFRGVLTAAK